MAMPAGYKPSPLGYGSPHSSPFRRAESPVSPSPLRQITPSASPYKGTPGGAGSSMTPGVAAATTPSSRLAGTPTPVPTSGGSWTPRNQHQPKQLQPAAEISGNERGAGADRSSSTRTAAAPSSMAQGSALSQLQPAQVRTLREGFQILDRDSDGTVGREDVADMLNQLGLPSTPSDVSQFFPPATPQTITMGTFLNALASALAALSPSTELLSALSAFDEDDSGQIDAAELRDALLHTAPEAGEPALTEQEINRVMQGFMGRRAFTNKSKPGPGFGGKRGEVFKYQEFVRSIAGTGQDAPGEDSKAAAEA